MKSDILLLGLPRAALTAAQYTVSSSAPSNDVFDSYMSYSIEFSSFPDFAGNKSQPNTFSDALLNNIGNIIGTKPYIRVGGNTQDYALYNASLPYAINGTFDSKRSADYPTTIFIGPSYFESYSTWKDVKFAHGFNLALGGNSSVGWQTLLDTVPLACKALGKGKLYWWEYGNEPDLFSTSAQGSVRPSGWNESIYVAQWLNGTKAIKAQLQTYCPKLVDNDTYGYLAPSFGGVNNHLKEPATWAAGLNVNGDIRLISTHNYISGASSPGVTLQGTLMNHTVTKRSVDAHIANYNKIKAIDPSAPPLIFGEHNSLYNQGKPGLSNTFGAALWGLDFNLYAASVGIKRVHMHMGTNYRYASWQPLTPMGTRAPYYGNIAVAAALGNLIHRPSTVVEILLNSSTSTAAAYAIYTARGSAVARLLVLNMNSYNTTVDGHGLDPLPAAEVPARPVADYTFIIPGDVASAGDKVAVRRLWANGSDAVTGITWDGWSYNYELDKGRPVRLGNVTVGERVVVGEGGVVRVGVPDASAVLLSF
ncbi:glycoside hydrolase superfamily [Podospora appendiculata]|uniref:Glycoside hydrolase superfamily n=1 Tax=Podospora appendiculata TaxID=314037 RepID=A0AAE1CGI5_9PEZI|nr:glycoside hydrolase superfamily [Podospora appendiculata]